MKRFFKKFGWTLLVVLLLDVFFRILSPIVKSLANAVWSNDVFSSIVTLLISAVPVCAIAAVYKLRSREGRMKYYDTIGRSYEGFSQELRVIFKDTDFRLEALCIAVIILILGAVAAVTSNFFKTVQMDMGLKIVTVVLGSVIFSVVLSAVYGIFNILTTMIIHKKWRDKNAAIEHVKDGKAE